VTSFFGIKGAFFCVFLENDKMDLRQILFRRKQFFITTCIEKQCTRPLSFILLTLAEKVQIMDRGKDTPDLNHPQPVVRES